MASLPSEHQIQSAVFDWWRRVGSKAHGVPACLYFATPNAGKRSIRAAMWYKAEGLTPGVPDTFLAVPVGEFHGLFIEHKRDSKKASEAQTAWMQAADEQGYECRVSQSVDQSIVIIESYLSRRKACPK